jgi:hypothetical protein
VCRTIKLETIWVNTSRNTKLPSFPMTRPRDGPIWAALNTFTVVPIVSKLADVRGAIWGLPLPFSVQETPLPFARCNCSVGIEHDPSAMWLGIEKISFVKVAIAILFAAVTRLFIAPPETSR